MEQLAIAFNNDIEFALRIFTMFALKYTQHASHDPIGQFLQLGNYINFRIIIKLSKTKMQKQLSVLLIGMALFLSAVSAM